MDNSISQCNLMKHVITKNETVSGIAKTFHESVPELIKDNPSLKNINNIKAGDSIFVHQDAKNISQKEAISNSDQTTIEGKMPWQNLEQLLKNGEKDNYKGAKITPEIKSGLFGTKHKTGNYNYTADGNLTYAQLKDQLGIPQDFELKDKNPNLINATNKDKIPKGTIIKFEEKTLPGKPLLDKNGKKVDGFTKSILSDTIYYTIQAGDTAQGNDPEDKADDIGIYDLFVKNKNVLKGYRTAGVVPKNTLIPGEKIVLEKKILGIF